MPACPKRSKQMTRTVANLLCGVSSAALLMTSVTSAAAQTISYGSDQNRATPIVLNNNGTVLDVSALAGRATQSGMISGSYRYTKTGGGTLVLTGNNTNDGILLNEGGLAAYHDNALGIGDLTMADGTRLEYGNGVDISNTIATAGELEFRVDADQSATQSGDIHGTGHLTMAGGGELHLSGSNTYSGGTFIGGGSRILALDINALGSGALRINHSYLSIGDAMISNDLQIDGVAVLETIGNANAHYTGTISGGTLLLNGEDGRLTLWGDNTHSGTTIAGGTVHLEHGNALGLGRARLAGQSTLSIADRVIVNNDLDITYNTKFRVGADQSAGIDGDITSAAGIGAFGLVKTGEGTLTLSGSNSYNGNTVVREGTLGFITANSLSANSSILSIEENGTAIFGAHQRINWLLGNGTLNIGSNGVTVGQGSFNGSISGSGDFVVDARGQYFTFGGDGTGLTGQINVRSGVLVVNGELGDLDGLRGGVLTVENSGWLEGNGRLGDVFVTGNGTLSNRQGRTLAMRSLVLDETGRVSVSLGRPDTGDVLFSIERDLTLDGTLSVGAATGEFGPGVYALMTYGGALTDNGMEIGQIPVGEDRSRYHIQTSVNGQVNLAIVAAQERLFWDGDGAGNADNGQIDGGSGTWRADSLNFTTIDGGSNGVMAPRPGLVIFQGQAGIVAVDNSAGNVSVTGMQFASNSYMIEGGAITLSGAEAIIRVGNASEAGASMNAVIVSDLRGNARLVKTDLGELILSGNNTYAGGTEIRQGSITVERSTALQGNVVNNAVLRYNSDGDLTVMATVSGTGLLEKLGNGELEVLTRQSYTGGTVIRAGTLRTRANNLVGPIENNAALHFDQTAGHDFFAGTISGSGRLIKSGAHDLTLRGETSYTGGTEIREGTLRVMHAEGLRGDVFNDGRLVYDSVSGHRVVASISGSGDFVKTGRSTLEMFGAHTYTGRTFIDEGTLRTRGDSIRGPIVNSAVLEFRQAAHGGHAGNIEGSGRLEKTGSGDLTLSGVNTYHGRTHIREGRLGFITANSFSVHSDLIIDGGATALFGAVHDIASVEGQGTLDIGSNGVSVGASGRSTTFDGNLAGSGVFRKTGEGTLTLAGNSAGFAGRAVVRDGTLDVQGRLGGRTMAVSVDGGTLTGTGQLGQVSVGGGTLRGIQGRTLSMDTLSMGSGGTMEVHLGMADGSAALFDVAGDLTLGGTMNVFDIGGFGPGVYSLVTYGGALTDNGMVIGRVPAGVDPAELSIQTSVSGQVNLANVAPDQRLFWDGDALGNADNGRVDGGNGIWRADSRNFTTMDGLNNGMMTPQPGFTIFQAAGGNVVVDDGAGAISVTGMQFASDGYVISGDALGLAGESAIVRVGNGLAGGAGFVAEVASNLTGAARLIKTDLGELILSGDNSYTGGTEIRQGAIRVTSAGGLRGEVVNNARLIYDTDVRLAVAATVSGSGTLVKDGSGILEVFGRHSYTGGTIIRKGTLVTRTGTIGGDILNDATLQFDQTGNGTFAGNIGGTGALVKTGAGNLTLTGANGYDGGTRVVEGGLYGTTRALRGNIEVATGARLGFDAARDGTYAGVLSGAGDVALDGAGTTWFTGNSSAFAGRTRVSEGALIVNGSLGGTITIDDGGRVGGSGTIGSTIVAEGGVLSPGNSIGTLTVNGDLTFETGSRYQVEVNPEGAESDLIRVTGDATLNGGSVLHIGANGNYDPLSVYRILSAEGGLTGEFNGVTSNFAFLTPDLIYDYDNGTVDLELDRNGVTFGQRAVSTNEKAVATNVEGLGVGNAVYDAIVTLPDDNAVIRRSFNLLSGEIHASLQTGLLMDSGLLRASVNERLHSAFAGGKPSGAIHAEGGFDVGAPEKDGIAFWSEAFGSWGHIDGDSNAAKMKRNTGGFVAGADAAFDNWRFGAVAGYGNSSLSISERASTASSDNYHIGAYGGGEWGGLSFRSGLAYAWHDISTTRSVRFAAFDEKLTANYDAGTLQAFGELGYRFDHGASTLEPFANLAYVHLDADGYSERGGAAALRGSANTQDATFTTLGLRASHLITTDSMRMRLHGMAAWQHAFGTSIATATHAMAGGANFTVAGVPMARDTALLEGGVNFLLGDNTQLGVAYQGQFTRGDQDHAVKANFEIRF
jgi:fibronectin-binding autotransporter adhesin